MPCAYPYYYTMAGNINILHYLLLLYHVMVLFFSTASNVDFVWITLPNLPERSKQNIGPLKLTNNGAQNGLVCWYRMEAGA